MMSLLVNSSYSPEDLDVLRSALDAWCTEKHIDIKSTEAQCLSRSGSLSRGT
jgi:hypothetical protein